MSSKIGEFGLTGNSGFVGCVHLSAPYDANGGVFVAVQDEEWGLRWVRKPEAEPGDSVITCDKCDKPAASVDHLWPYGQGYNRCAEHYGDE